MDEKGQKVAGTNIKEKSQSGNFQKTRGTQARPERRRRELRGRREENVAKDPEEGKGLKGGVSGSGVFGGITLARAKKMPEGLRDAVSKQNLCEKWKNTNWVSREASNLFLVGGGVRFQLVQELNSTEQFAVFKVKRRC